MANSSTKSINQVISRLKKIQKRQGKINYWFFRYSLNWIKNRANTLLDQRSNGYNSSHAREWNIIIYENSAILENQDPNSGAIEFGTGIVGKYLKDPKARNDPHIPAQENNYQYNVESASKNDGYWTYKLPFNEMYITTRGYGGKSFLFDSLMEYKHKNLAFKFYQKAFDKVMKGIVK